MQILRMNEKYQESKYIDEIPKILIHVKPDTLSEFLIKEIFIFPPSIKNKTPPLLKKWGSENQNIDPPLNFNLRV